MPSFRSRNVPPRWDNSAASLRTSTRSASITARIGELRKALPPGVHIHYAMKANPMPQVVGHILPLVDGLDVASPGYRTRKVAPPENADETLRVSLEPADESGILVLLVSGSGGEPIAGLT